MAPEQVVGDVAAIGPRCDIYSLGVLLYELLTGRRPFEGPTAKVLGLVQFAEPTPPSEYRPDLDRRLEAICRRAMAKKIEDRYPSMAALAGALDQYLRDTPAAGPADEDRGGPSDRSSSLLGPQQLTGPKTEAMPRRRPPTQGRGLVALGLAAPGLLGSIIWITTDTGTVRIDVKDPNVTVHVDGQEIRIEAMGRPLTLRVGEHHLRVTRDDLVVETQTFEVRRHDQTVVEVNYTPRASAGAQAGSHPTPISPAPPPWRQSNANRLLSLPSPSPRSRRRRRRSLRWAPANPSRHSRTRSA